MAVVTITLGGVNVTPLVIFSSAIFDSQVNGKPGTCKFRIRDESGTATYIPGSDLLLEIDGDPIWAGYATVIQRVYVFPALDLGVFGAARFFDISGVDLNIFFQRRIVFNQADPEDIYGTLFPVGTPDTTAITDLLANFLDLTGDSLDTSSGVTNVGDITIDQEGRAWQGSDRWGDAMTSIARIPGAIFYITPDRVLRYVDDDTADAPFGLSDIAGYTIGDLTFKTYREMEILVDGTGLANDVLGWGAGYGSDEPVFRRVTDTDSITAHGLWQDAKSYFGTFKQDTLDANVNSIVYGSPTNLRGAKDDKLAVTLTTFAPGFQPAQKVMFFSEIFGWDEVLPIRKMTIRFPAPDTPKYELVLSHEIDTPFDIIDNLLFDNRLPPKPPIIEIGDPPNPPPPAPISCGITDDFNRADVGPYDGLGIASSGRTWGSAYGMYVQGLRGRAIGFLSDLWEDSGLGITNLYPLGILQQPWPVPFGGSIVLTDADTFPGFSLESEPELVNSSGGIFYGGENITDANELYVTSLPAAGGVAGSASLTAHAGPLYNAYEPVTITGHIRANKIAGSTHEVHRGWDELDHFFYFSWSLGSGDMSGGCRPFRFDNPYIRNVYVHGGSPLEWPNLPQPEEVEIPPRWEETGGLPNAWATDGEADFEITYTGGVGGVLEFTLAFPTMGSYTVTYDFTGTDAVASGTFAMSISLHADQYPDEQLAEAWLSNFRINGEEVENGVSWGWELTGLDIYGNVIAYYFYYTDQIGNSYYPNGYQAGYVPYGDPGGNAPAAKGPLLWATMASDEPPGRQVVAYVELDAPLTFPETPFVAISAFGGVGVFQMAGETVILDPSAAVDNDGDAAPIGPLDHFTSNLSMRMVNRLGTFIEFDDLNVIGVNACTTGLINPGNNWLSVSFTGDGTRTTFTLPGPFLRGTAAVYVGGARQRQVVDYIEGPDAGTIMFATAPAAGAVIVVSYYPAVSGGGPSPPSPPTPPPPAGQYIAPPVTTATYEVPDTIDHSGATDVSAELIAWIDTVPDGSIIDFAIPGAVYRMASGGMLFQQRSNLDVRGHSWTTSRIYGNGNDEARSAFLIRASDHISIDGFTVIADGVSITASEGEAAHALGISGYFALGESSYIAMSNVTASHLKGDGVYIEGSNGGAFPPSHHVWVYNCNFDYMGRNGVSFINCTDVLIESNTFDHVSYHAVDFEANFAAEEITNVTVRNNSFGSYAHRTNLIGFFVADSALGLGSVTSNVLIHNNIVAGIAANGYDGTPRALDSKFFGDAPGGTARHDNITFTANSTPRARNANPVIYGFKIDTFVVTGNHQPLPGGVLVDTDDCTNVTDSPNP